MKTETAGPLSGMRVLDFSRVLSGPSCTMLLADLGAEVLKVEPPEGDVYRHTGPFVDGRSALFSIINRGKRSIVLDLKTKEHQQIASTLVASSDIVVENFRPGVADRLGIGYEQLSKTNPQLIYASISGFGQSGPESHRPTFDIVIQAMTGLMDLTGKPGEEPTMVGEPVADLLAGLYASWAILAAVVLRARTGVGQYIDVSMFDTLFCLLPTALTRGLCTEEGAVKVGNRHPLSAPFGMFKCADGYVVIAILRDDQFVKLTDVMEEPRLRDRTVFGTNEARVANNDLLSRVIENWTSTQNSSAIVDLLTDAGIPAAPVSTLAEAIRSDHVRDRGLIRYSTEREGTSLPYTPCPVRFSTFEADSRQRAPDLGEHTHEIVSESDGKPRRFGSKTDRSA